MGDGVTTTGSLLNNRLMRAGKSNASKKGSGVKLGPLVQTRITLANRNLIGGRSSYAALSNGINGRKEVIYVNTGGSSCSGTCSNMSTLDKIQQYSALAMQGVQLADGIASLFKTEKSEATGNTETTTGTQQTISLTGGAVTTGGATATGANQSLASTLSLIDIDYKDGANDFISQMNKADNSQDLYQALQGAKAYKSQVDTRLASINIENLNSTLKKLESDAQGSIKSAKKALDTADAEVKTAESEVKKGEQQLQAERRSYEVAKNALEEKNAEYKAASKNVDVKTIAYDNCSKKLTEAKENYRIANSNLDQAKSSYSTAQLNTREAQANLDALKSQQSFSDSVALQAQIASAEAQLDSAKKAEEMAKKEVDNASQKLTEALEAKDQAQTNANLAKKELKMARDNVSKIAQQMAERKEITAEQLKLVQDRQSSLETAEGTLEQRKDTLIEKKETQTYYENVLAGLEAKKEEVEMQIDDYKEMKKASEKLNDLSSYETKLEKMMKKENIKRDELEEKLAKKNAVSNDANASAGQRARAARSEERITNRLVDLNAGDATDDIARDKNTQIHSQFNTIADLANSGLLSGKSTVNGHTVEIRDGKYYVDGGTTGLDRHAAEMLVKLPLIKAPNINRPNFGSGNTVIGSGSGSTVESGETLVTGRAFGLT